jgi:glycosyltransferase involved in cell wall biosynthesis
MIRVSSIVRQALRRSARHVWKIIVNYIIATSICSPKKSENGQPRVYFAGALSGNRGGPRVKLTRLVNHFPQHTLNFNLVYCLSNFPYLNQKTLTKIRSQGIPVVLNQNGVYFPSWYGTGWEKQNYPNAVIYQSSDYVFWQSQFARESSREFLTQDDPPGEVLFNAVDLNLFSPSAQIFSGPFSFLVAGNFNRHSIPQIEPTLEALSIISKEHPVRVVIAGLDNESMKLVKEISNRLCVSEVVEILGPYSNSSAPELMRTANCYIALKYMDTCPNLVIEAMASGLPVIYSATGGTKELLDGECGVGLQVPESWYDGPYFPDVDAVANAMLRVMDSASQMSQKSRERAESLFDIRKWYSRHEEVFLRILEDQL